MTRFKTSKSVLEGCALALIDTRQMGTLAKRLGSSLDRSPSCVKAWAITTITFEGVSRIENGLAHRDPSCIGSLHGCVGTSLFGEVDREFAFAAAMRGIILTLADRRAMNPPPLSTVDGNRRPDCLAVKKESPHTTDK